MISQPETVLPSWLQRVGRRSEVGTAQVTTLHDSYQRHCAQQELEKAAEITARRTSDDSASIQVHLLHGNNEARLTVQSGCRSIKQAPTSSMEDQFTCPACEQLLSRCHDLKKHWHDHCRVQVHHYQCKKCDHQTVSKSYPKKLQSLRKEAAAHELELVRILPAKAFGCPCCGAYLANLKEMKKHVLKKSGHDFKQISRPDAAGQIRRLRGLLQQPDIMRELEDQCSSSGCELKGWIASLSWDGPVAKQFADRLQYGVRVEPNGHDNVGILPRDMSACIAMVIASARGDTQHIEMPASSARDSLSDVFGAPLELASRLLLEKEAPMGDELVLSNRHKRCVSTTSSDISEGFLRSQNAPFLPIERIEFAVPEVAQSPSRPYHLLHPIQTTGLCNKPQPIDSGYVTDSARPLDTAFTLSSSSTAPTLFTSTSIYHVKPWDEEPNLLVELPESHDYHEMPADLYYNDDDAIYHGVKF